MKIMHNNIIIKENYATRSYPLGQVLRSRVAGFFFISFLFLVCGLMFLFFQHSVVVGLYYFVHICHAAVTDFRCVHTEYLMQFMSCWEVLSKYVYELTQTP